jgi:hypothetical protein
MSMLPRRSNSRALPTYQKNCPQCRQIVHADLSRCASCGHSPWVWRANTRYLMLTLLFAIVGMSVIYPLMKPVEPFYRTPMVDATPEQREQTSEQRQ